MKRVVFTTVTAAAIALSSLSAPFIPVSTQVVQAAAAEALPTYKSRADIPAEYKWKTEQIYQDKAAWDADVQKIEQLAGNFAKLEGTITSSDTLKVVLDSYSDLMSLNDKAYVYAHLNFDVNSSNSSMQALSDRADKMSNFVKQKTAWLSPELNKIDDKQMAEYLADPRLVDYKTFVGDILRGKPHTLSADMEKLLSEVAPLGDTPDDIYTMLAKDVKFPTIKDERGKDVQLTRANFISYMESKNPTVRRAAFQAYYQTLDKFRDTFTKTLAGQVKVNNVNAKVHKYNTALEAALTPNNVPTAVYDELISTVDQNLPLLHRYMGLKKKLLGLKELHMYDIYTPIVQADQKYIPYDKAKQMVLDGLKPLGEEYVGVLRDQAFSKDGGWIDVYSTEDKTSGAYQWGSYTTHPYLLLNYQGTEDDVSTMAHELGHAMQSYYTNKNQKYINSNYPIFTAEVASTMNEALLFKYNYANAKTREEKLFLLNQHLENFRTTLFRQTQFAEFEKTIHEAEQRGDALTSDFLKKTYLDINKKYYGPSMVSDPEIAMEWARIPHFYMNFYVYQYATSFAASTALSKQVLEEGKPAVDRIRDKFLSAGNSAAPIDVLKAAGVDMSTPQPIEQAMQVFKESLDEFEKLVNQKPSKPAAGTGGKITVKVNGKTASFTQAPFTEQGRTYAPMSAILKLMGAKVDWNSKTGVVTATKGKDTFTLKIGEASALFNGKKVDMKGKSQVKKGTTFIPVAAIGQAFGAKVAWDTKTQTVSITTGK
ncbi:oligoendopeptidase F [Aneurinibacillus tyrosinisolvens]|uniref:oligoendopeptidase F n=1 Tax=Aneurinibacillus tyrosinisolvens TaxID=1443435 RepID=UPI000A40A309|nr:oligoendopeptidase F [Aneurinibacillus tyrosinisolvens]